MNLLGRLWRQVSAAPALGRVRSKLAAHPLAVCLTAALMLRILPATIHFVIGTDEALYLTLARNLAAGLGFTADGVTPHTEFAPMYPILAAFVYRLGADLELPSRLNILVFGGLLVVPVWGLAKDMCSEAVAWRAAALAALLPALALSVPNWEAPTEQVYSVLLWAGLWVTWRTLKKPSLAHGALAGLLLGLTHVTRIEGLYYVALAGVLMAVNALRHKARSRWGAAIAFAAAASACVVPYSLYVHTYTGLWLAPKGVLHQYHGAAIQSDDPLVYEAAYTTYEENMRNLRALPSIPSYLWEHRAELPSYYARNLVRELVLPFKSPVFLPVTWAPFALAGLWSLRRARPAWWPTAFLGLALGPAVIYHPLSVVDPRYLLPLLPAPMIWAAIGLSELEARWRPGRALTMALAGLFLTADLLGPFYIPRPTEYRALGMWMRQHGISGYDVGVLARKRQPAFYAGARWEWLPLADTAGLLDYAASHHGQYVVIDERTVPALRPQLAYLLDPAQGPPRLKVVHVEEGAKEVVLYQIFEDSAP